jgi:hypothetical protein
VEKDILDFFSFWIRADDINGSLSNRMQAIATNVVIVVLFGWLILFLAVADVDLL